MFEFGDRVVGVGLDIKCRGTVVAWVNGVVVNIVSVDVVDMFLLDE